MFHVKQFHNNYLERVTMKNRIATYEALASRNKMSPKFDLLAETLDTSSLIGGKFADYELADTQRGNGAGKWLSARLEADGTTSLVIVNDELVSNNTDLEKITVVLKKSSGEIYWLKMSCNEKARLTGTVGKEYNQKGLVRKMTAIQRADYLAQLAKIAQTAEIGKTVDDQAGMDYFVKVGQHLDRFVNGSQSWKREHATK